MTANQTVIELEEYREKTFSKDQIAEEVGEYMFHEYSDKVSIEPPSFKSGHLWKLTSQGWVGFLPINAELGLSLKPKVALSNLFRMLEYAYNLKSFKFLEGSTTASSLQEFYERLANVLAKRVLVRARQGFYRTYIQEQDRLPYLRGSLDIRDRLRRPWSAHLACEFEENTADIEENQILAWTLLRAARSGACSERVLPNVRRAYRAISSFTTVQPCSSEVCVDRLYNRLNDDYQPMHALCRFFLENSGPTHEIGDRRMLPFVVNMARLFELFVAEWLKSHAPSTITIQAQETVGLGAARDFRFDIDIVLSDAITGKPFAVLDTKYKKPQKYPDQADVSQVVTYAELKGCTSAYLAYPEQLQPIFDETIGNIQVKSVEFGIAGDLEEAGRSFLSEILQDDLSRTV